MALGGALGTHLSTHIALGGALGTHLSTQMALGGALGTHLLLSLGPYLQHSNLGGEG